MDLLRALGLAPCARSSFTISVWPFALAMSSYYMIRLKFTESGVARGVGSGQVNFFVDAKLDIFKLT